MSTQNTTRNLLLKLGIGGFNATAVTPNMGRAPRTSDPKSPHIILVVSAMQDRLNEMGYGLQRTGYLDPPTAAALAEVVGPDWIARSWRDVIARLLAAQNVPGAYMAADRLRARTPIDQVTFADVPFGLPEVPGGIVTYGVAAFFLWRFLKKRKG